MSSVHPCPLCPHSQGMASRMLSKIQLKQPWTTTKHCTTRKQARSEAFHCPLRTDPRERAQERNCKAVIRLGYTNLPSWEVERIVKWMENTHWGADSYHPLAHNCNCFCKQLARFLGLSVPSWVNTAARWAAPFAPLIVVEGGVATWDGRGAGLHPHPILLEASQCGRCEFL